VGWEAPYTTIDGNNETYECYHFATDGTKERVKTSKSNFVKLMDPNLFIFALFSERI